MPHYTSNLQGVTKEPGHFEAISFMPRKGVYLRTRHETRAKAEKRLQGCPRHEGHQIVDHTPRKAG